MYCRKVIACVRLHQAVSCVVVEICTHRKSKSCCLCSGVFPILAYKDDGLHLEDNGVAFSFFRRHETAKSKDGCCSLW